MQIKLPVYNTRVKLPTATKDTIYDGRNSYCHFKMFISITEAFCIVDRSYPNAMWDLFGLWKEISDMSLEESKLLRWRRKALFLRELFPLLMHSYWQSVCVCVWMEWIEGKRDSIDFVYFHFK